MADSNATTGAAPAAPVDTTPPWERVWNDVKTAVVEKAQDVQSMIQQPTMPWEKNWGATPSAQAPTQPTSASPVTPSPADKFSNVFNKLVGTESGGKHTDASGNLTTSSAGAEGITQVMPKTGGDPGYGVTPIQNNSSGEYIRFGKDYLNAMLKNFGGDYEKAVGAYNAGPGTIEKAVATAQQKGGDWKLYLPAKAKKETIPYINKILGT